MASSMIFFIILSVLAASIPSILATEHVVGDDNGWKLNFDYIYWTATKEFRVGDKLVFNYKEGVHNVMKVDGTGFTQCAAPAGTLALTSGNDVINLTTSGRKWYICGVGSHCATGNMKLAITVLAEGESPAPVPAPSPSPASGSEPSAATARTNPASTYYISITLILSILGLAIA